MRAVNRLTAAKIKSATKPGLYADGLGLALQVSQWGTRAWVLRFMMNGRPRKLGLGPANDVTLAEAREAAHEARKQIRAGIDPVEARRVRRAEARSEAARQVTFKECCEMFLAAKEGGWRNEKHRGQWRSTLALLYPVLGSLPVAMVDTPLVLKALDPIWKRTPETGSRLRGRIERVLSYATARQFRSGDNPARWVGHLKDVLPNKKQVRKPEHHPALPYTDLPSFMGDLCALDSLSAHALELTILTAARTQETLGARWDEIGLDERTWTVPADRMKAGKEHRVPLSDRAVAILLALPRDDSGYVFPGAKAGRSLSESSMLKLLRGLRSELTVHGFRSTFRDWAAERTAYPREVAEAALAHTIPDKVEAAYRRSDLFDKRRRLMAEWSKFCASTPVKKGELVAIGRVG